MQRQPPTDNHSLFPERVDPSSHFTPTEDLKLLWTKCYYPQSSWTDISRILNNQFSIIKNPHVLKHRYENYLNIPALRNMSQKEMERKEIVPFLTEERKRKNPEQFLQLYRQIKEYHEKTKTNKREQIYEREVIKKELYPNFQDSLHNFEAEASKYLKILSLSEEYDLLRLKETQELTETQASKLQKIEKIYFRCKQMRLENQKKISKLHRIIRHIISTESRCFAEDILINEMNIGKLLVKVLKSVYSNCLAIAQKLIGRNKKERREQIMMQQKRELNRWSAKKDGKHQQTTILDYLCDERATNRSRKSQIRGKQQELSQNSEASLSDNLFLEDFTNIQKFYSESSDPLYRKDIIKLFYFPAESASKNKSQIHADEAIPTPDGQILNLRRLTLILKMFKKLEIMQLKRNQKTENEIKADIQSIQYSGRWPRGREEDEQDNNYSLLDDYSKGGTARPLQRRPPLPSNNNQQPSSSLPTSHIFNPNSMQKGIPNPGTHGSVFQVQGKKGLLHNRLEVELTARQRSAARYKNKYALDERSGEDELQIIGQSEYYTQREKHERKSVGRISSGTLKRTFPNPSQKLGTIRNQNRGGSSEDLSPFPPEQIYAQQNLYFTSPPHCFDDDAQPFQSPFDRFEREKPKSLIDPKKELKPKKRVISKKAPPENKQRKTKKTGKKSRDEEQRQGSLIDALLEPFEAEVDPLSGPSRVVNSLPMTLDQAVESTATRPYEGSRKYLMGMIEEEIGEPRYPYMGRKGQAQ